jgi:hypothetical protein
MSSGQRERIEPLGERRLRLSADLKDQLEVVRGDIDAVFGPGYAKGHPQLVGVLVQANSTDTQADVIAERLLWLGEALEALAVAVERLNGRPQ